MPTTFLNTQQAYELSDALEHAISICKKDKKDASIVSIGNDNWVAMHCEHHEHFDQTLVRVCFSEADISDGKHEWGTAYKSSETGEIKFMKNKK